MPSKQSWLCEVDVRHFSWSAAGLAGVMVLAAALRSWGVWSGELVWHPDEIIMVLFPLGFFSGDFNPHHFHYPTAHFYVLGVIYGLVYLSDLAQGNAGNLYEWVALHGLFEMERLRDVARWASVAFSLGTMGWTMLICTRLMGRSVPVLAALTVAVSVLHVRQSQIAGVDNAMTFWFMAALWAAARLQAYDRQRDYLLCGAFIGLCAGTKYPGAASAGPVVAAHLLAGRGFFDRRLWAAGVSSLAVFTLVSPYVWLDFETFSQHFLLKIEHVRIGNSEVYLPALHHLWITLRHNLGEPAWLLMLGVTGWALIRRDREIVVVLSGLVAAYAFVSWGELVFTRYALPMFPVQAILVTVGMVTVAQWLSDRYGSRRSWLCAVAVAVLALPAAHSIQVVQISAAQDTRTQARLWMESHVSSGSRCCNFGGWAGDIQVRTLQELWWLLVRHEDSYGLARLRNTAEHLQRKTPNIPYYSFNAGGDRDASEHGSWGLVDGVQCDFVLTHDHPLPSSHLDASFVAQLQEKGTRRATFTPGNVGRAVFDDMDAYYIPIAGFEGLQRPGPQIEIWQIDNQPTTDQPPPSVAERLASSHGLLARSAARDGQMALSLRAIEAWAHIASQLGRTQDAEAAFRELNYLEPQFADGLEGLAQLLTDEGRLVEAAEAARAAAELQPTSARARRWWGQALYAALDVHSGLRVLHESLKMDPRSAEISHILGAALYQSGDSTAAVEYLDRAVQLNPQSAKYHIDAAMAHARLKHPERARVLRRQAVALDSTLVDGHRLTEDNQRALD
jgi:Flp pilus assembly protein TadD